MKIVFRKIESSVKLNTNIPNSEVGAALSLLSAFPCSNINFSASQKGSNYVCEGINVIYISILQYFTVKMNVPINRRWGGILLFEKEIGILPYN